VSGGTSQSLVNEEAGARTPLSTAFAGVFVFVVILFFSHLLSALPQSEPAPCAGSDVWRRRAHSCHKLFR
jgi:hypothetical protein